MDSYNVVKIESYWGRLCNNICQLHNAILIALSHNYDMIEFPPHKMFKCTKIDLTNRVRPESCVYITDTTQFFTLSSRFSVTMSEKNIETANKYMDEVFIYGSVSIQPTDALVIHIRSGDIFRQNPHSGYMQPPLQYYTQIIDKLKPKQITILTEDRLNPCTNKLLELYSNARLMITDIDTAIQTILAAKTIVCGVGLFVPILLYFSKNLETLHTTQGINTKFLKKKNVTVEFHDMSAYKTLMGNAWLNSPDQRKLMLTYKKQT